MRHRRIGGGGQWEPRLGRGLSRCRLRGRWRRPVARRKSGCVRGTGWQVGGHGRDVRQDGHGRPESAGSRRFRQWNRPGGRGGVGAGQLLRENHDGDSTVARPPLRRRVVRDGTVLAIPDRAQPAGIHSRLFAEEPDRGGRARRRKLPVAGIRNVDGHIVGVADHVHLPMGMLGQHRRQPPQNLLPLRLELRLPGVEQDVVQDLDGELALQIGDGDGLRLEGPPHLLLEALLRPGRLLLFGLEAIDLGLVTAQLARALLGQIPRLRQLPARLVERAVLAPVAEAPKTRQRQNRKHARHYPSRSHHKNLSPSLSAAVGAAASSSRSCGDPKRIGREIKAENRRGDAGPGARAPGG